MSTFTILCYEADYFQKRNGGQPTAHKLWVRLKSRSKN